MQEIVNKNNRLGDATKHVGGVLCEKTPTLDDMQFNEDGNPTSFRHY
jgi:hypothetical protein